MNDSKSRSALEIVTSIVVLITAIGVSTLFLVRYYRARQAVQLELENGLQKGKKLPSIAGLTYGDSSRTLLIVMNAQCAYCAESVPFYNRVVETLTKPGSSAKIVALFPNPEAEVKRFVEDRGLKARVISEANLADIRLAGTPTLVLVDESGSIQDFWIGKLSPQTEQKVMRSMTYF